MRKKETPDPVRELLPLSPAVFYILFALAEGEKHGYAIMKDIESFSGNTLLPGTLYTAITRLVEKGWIEPEDVEHRQRPYRITRAGIRRLQGQLESMRRITSIGFRRLRFS